MKKFVANGSKYSVKSRQVQKGKNGISENAKENRRSRTSTVRKRGKMGNKYIIQEKKKREPEMGLVKKKVRLETKWN